MSAQMLARLCGQEEEALFRYLTHEAEQIAATLPPQSSLSGQLFSPGALLMDACSYYRHIGKFERAREYLVQAEKTLPDTPYWGTRLLCARGLLLVYSGNLEEGMPSVIKAVQLGQEQGNQVLLEQFYVLERFMGRTALDWSEAKLQLSEELHGHGHF